MKKTFFYLVITASIAVCNISCGSDDESFVTPPAPEVLPQPEYSAQAATFSITDNIASNNGGSLKKVIITESGKAVFAVDVNGKMKYASYDISKAENGTYTIDGVGTVTSSTVRGTSGTTLVITITITIDGVTYTFTTQNPVEAQMAYEQMTGGTKLNSIARTWVVQSMFLTLDGDVSLSKLEKSGDLSVLAAEAQKRDAGLTEKEMSQLNKVVNGFTLDKNGNFIIEYTEKGGSKSTEVCTWTWNGNNMSQFILDMDTDMGNKFLSNNSKVDVEFNAAGGCTFSLTTKISGNKTYTANMIVVLK